MIFFSSILCLDHEKGLLTCLCVQIVNSKLILYETFCVDSSNSRAKKRALQHQMCSKSADLALVTAEGKPVRREGPKWDAKRINQETLFVLGKSILRHLS